MFSVRTASLAGLTVPAESGNDLMMEVAYWTGALVASVLVILIAIVILRKLLRRDRDTKKVDAVRIGEIWKQGHFTFKVKGPRIPCSALYTTLSVNTNGNVSICCLDSFNGTNMGNVFKDGVKAVWHGPKLTAMRRLHERGQWDKITLCKNCDRWASYQYEEEVRDGLLIRRSPEYTYYNRIDRLENWHKELHGTHQENQEKLLKESCCAS